MMGIVLSIFDKSRGPIILLAFPGLHDDNRLKQLPFLMDVHEEGFFLHEFDDLRTANWVFKTDNPQARGGIDTIMLSVVSYKEPIAIDLRSYREIIEYFIHKLQHSLELCKGINFEAFPSEYKKLATLVMSFYRFLIKEKIFFEENFEQKVFYELSHVGKTCLLNRLNATFPDNTNRIWV